MNRIIAVMFALLLMPATLWPQAITATLLGTTVRF